MSLEKIPTNPDICTQNLITALEQIKNAMDPEATAALGAVMVGFYPRDSDVAVRLPAEARGVPVPADLSQNTHFVDGQEWAAQNMLLSLLLAHDPAAVRFTFWDCKGTGDFGPFVRGLGGLARQFGGTQERLRQLLDESWEHQVKAASSGLPLNTPVNPREVLVLAGGTISPHLQEKLANLLRVGPEHRAVQVITVGTEGIEECNLSPAWPGYVEAVPESPLPPEAERMAQVEETCRGVAEEAIKGTKPPMLDEILPIPATNEELMQESAKYGLEITVGQTLEGNPYTVTLEGGNSHVLCTGTTGSGKTSTMTTIQLGLAMKYPPSELQMYVLDGKSDHAPIAELPQAHMVGVGLEKDHDFAMSIVREVKRELQERVVLFERHGSSNYQEFRNRNPDQKLPRIVFTIDEVQVFLNSPIGNQMAETLIDLARRGRSYGIHLCIGTQTLSGIQALFANKRSLVGQLGVRVSGREPENPEDPSLSDLPTMQTIVTDTRGKKRIVRVAAAFDDPAKGQPLSERRARIREAAGSTKPAVYFNGQTVPTWNDKARTSVKAKRDKTSTPQVALGVGSSVKDPIVSVPLRTQNGANLAIIGSGDELGETERAMSTAISSLAEEPPETVQFELICINPESEVLAQRHAEELKHKGHNVRVVSGPSAVKQLIDISYDAEDGLGTGDRERRIVTVYGADHSVHNMVNKPSFPLPEGSTLKVTAGLSVKQGQHIADGPDGSAIYADYAGTIKASRDGKILRLEMPRTGQAYLADIVNKGPSQGLHVIAHVSRGEGIKGLGNPDSWGAFVAFGAQGTSLNPLVPGLYGKATVETSPGPNRGYYFNRAVGGSLKTVIPFNLRA